MDVRVLSKCCSDKRCSDVTPSTISAQPALEHGINEHQPCHAFLPFPEQQYAGMESLPCCSAHSIPSRSLFIISILRSLLVDLWLLPVTHVGFLGFINILILILYPLFPFCLSSDDPRIAFRTSSPSLISLFVSDSRLLLSSPCFQDSLALSCLSRSDHPAHWASCPSSIWSLS